MKKTIIVPMLALGILMLYSPIGLSQALLSTDDNFTEADPSTMLHIHSPNSGLLIPTITLTYDEGNVVAPSIPNPTDGLIIFHDGSNSIEKGFWFYDDIPQRWVSFTDFTTQIAQQSLDDFAEIYESKDLGSGTPYDLYLEYYVPWASGTPGWKGDAFSFEDDVDVVVNPPSTTMPADQLKISSSNDAIYSVEISATIASTTPANTITGKLFKNGNEVSNIFFRYTFQLKDKPTSLNTSGNIQLSPGDVIDFRFTSTEKNKGIEVENMNIRLAKLGEI